VFLREPLYNLSCLEPGNLTTSYPLNGGYPAAFDHWKGRQAMLLGTFEDTPSL
jgi:hypothetical protein